MDFHQWSTNSFVKLSRDTNSPTGAKSISETQQLANELQKSISRIFQERKTDSFFRDNIMGSDLAHMQLIGKYNVLLIFTTNMLGLSN